jgi:hypothetical protein
MAAYLNLNKATPKHSVAATCTLATHLHAIRALVNQHSAPAQFPTPLQSLSGVPMVGGMVGGMGRASRARKDDLRLTHANILRVLADNLPSGALLKNYNVPEARQQGNVS